MEKKTKLINSKEYKELIILLLQDYIDVKKEASSLGYDEKAFKLKDYFDYYVRLNETK